MKCLSLDQTEICFEQSGTGSTTLIFAHGWMGNKRWWDSQRDFFSKSYQIVQLDMGGHGDSSKTRIHWSAENYANDIIAVAKTISNENIILVGHSMSGVYATLASLQLPKVKALIVVDILKDLDHIMSSEQISQIFALYLKDFKAAVNNILPLYMFGKATPSKIKEKLQQEFLLNSGEFAVKVLEPLYKIDPREFAKKVKIPVRAINTDIGPTNIENNKKYFKDYACTIMEGLGHYPMLEDSEKFNLILKKTLQDLPLP